MALKRIGFRYINLSVILNELNIIFKYDVLVVFMIQAINILL